tara:strand:+ start:325 stop:579 length:255 start_codon:yes stop_codon:yes gene_type:complete
MTEKEIQLLGFEKQKETAVPSYHYYTYTIARGFEFISCANDEVDNKGWCVEFFDSDPQIRFYDFEEVQTLINLLEKRIVKPKQR